MTIIENYRKNIAVNRIEINKLQEQKNNYDLKLREMQKSQDKIKYFHLDTPKLSSMFFVVEKLIVKNKLKLIDMVPGEVETIDSLSFQDLKINAVGEYFDLIKFMTELNQLQFYFSIPEYEMFKLQDDDGEENKLIKLKLNIRLYYPILS